MSRPVYETNRLEEYESYAEFQKRFTSGVNPVMEWWRRTSRLHRANTPGDFILLLVMHHDYADPFLVELPWSADIVAYVHKNAVDILQLP